MLLDTGASVSVLDASALYLLGLTKDDFVSPVSLGAARVIVADGQSMPLLGAVDCLFLMLGSCTHRRVQMLVAERLCGVDALLGLDLLMSIGAKVNPNSHKNVATLCPSQPTSNCGLITYTSNESFPQF